MKTVGRLFDVVINIFAILASVILVAMMLATVVKVGMRVVSNYGIMGIDQISGTMMVYMTFLGAAWVLRNDSHVMVDLLTSSVGERAQRAINIIGSLVSSVVCFAMTYFSINAINLSLRRGIMIAAEFEIPRAINLVVIPIGCALLGIEFLRRARRFYTGEALPVQEIREH